jgi:hypothetical protein
MDGEQRFLHYVVEQRRRTNAFPQKRAHEPTRLQQKLRVSCAVAGLGFLKEPAELLFECGVQAF